MAEYSDYIQDIVKTKKVTYICVLSRLCCINFYSTSDILLNIKCYVS